MVERSWPVTRQLAALRPKRSGIGGAVAPPIPVVPGGTSGRQGRDGEAQTGQPNTPGQLGIGSVTSPRLLDYADQHIQSSTLSSPHIAGRETHDACPSALLAHDSDEVVVLRGAARR